MWAGAHCRWSAEHDARNYRSALTTRLGGLEGPAMGHGNLRGVGDGLMLIGSAVGVVGLMPVLVA
jgi:hypothetical protein